MKHLWRRRNVAWLGLLLAFALVVSACGDDDSTETTGSTEAPAGTEAPTTEAPVATEAPATTEAPAPAQTELIWAHEQEPPDLHLDDPNNNLTIASWIQQGMWEGLYGDTSDLRFFPELLDGEGVLSEGQDGSVTAAMTLREETVWSDGTCFSAWDVYATQEIIMAQAEVTNDEGETSLAFVYELGDRTGYDTITGMEFDMASDCPKSFSITWSAPFGGWKSLFNRVFPHQSLGFDPANPGAFDAAAAAAKFNDDLRTWTVSGGQDGGGAPFPSTGPLVFDFWEPGVRMHFNINPMYHGNVSPDVTNGGAPTVSGVMLQFVPDTDAQVNAIKAGEAHFITAQPQLAFEELATDSRFAIVVAPGPIYEHWGMNLTNKHLNDPLVREALLLAFDKTQIVQGLYDRIFGPGVLDPEGLWNTFVMANQAGYEQHGADLYGGAQIEAARAKLEEAGYDLSGDVAVHPERGELRLRVGTTGGNALRELQQQLGQQAFAPAGIAIEIENVPGAAYFGEIPFSGESLAISAAGEVVDPSIWELTQFAWVGGPWPGGQSGAYRSTSGFMPYGFVSPEWDARSIECDSILDTAASIACYNEIDKSATIVDVDNPLGGASTGFMMPISQKPTFFAADTDALTNVATMPDTNNGGPLVNVVDYQLG